MEDEELICVCFIIYSLLDQIGPYLILDLTQ